MDPQMAEIVEPDTTAAGTPNAPIHGDEETTPEPEQPQFSRAKWRMF